MSALTIDTLAVSQTLRKRGFTEDQAIGVVEAKLETTAANLKVDIRRWLIVTQIALGGFVFAAIKLTK
jgi:hypothetical protein